MKNKKNNKDELVYLWGNTFPLFNVENAIGYTILDDILGARSELVFYLDNGYKTSLGKKRSLDRAYKHGDAFLKDEVYELYIERMKKLFKRREEFIKKINTEDLSKLSGFELFKYAKEYGEIFKRFFGHMATSRPETVDHLTGRLLKKLQEKSNNKNITNEEMNILLSSSEPDIIKKEKMDRYKIIDNTDYDTMKNHIIKHHWLYSYMYTQKETINQFKEDLKKENKKNLKKEIEEFTRELKETKEKRNEIIKKYNDDEITLLSSRLSFLGHNRFEIKAGWAGLLIAVSPLFEEIGKRHEIKVKFLVNNYLTKDLENLLYNNKKLLEPEIEKRKKIIFYTDKDKIVTKMGVEAIDYYKNNLIKHIEAKTSSVEGKIASKGRCIGICRKIELKEDMDISLFKKGEILVTEMTAPSMVPIMKKSAGIIINEGGIMSHAAVVSREFNIPCIVGTGVATKVFETGDKIELDAENGVATKIK